MIVNKNDFEASFELKQKIIPKYKMKKFQELSDSGMPVCNQCTSASCGTDI